MTWHHPALGQRALNESDKEIAALKAEIERLLTGLNVIAGWADATSQRDGSYKFSTVRQIARATILDNSQKKIEPLHQQLAAEK